MNTEERIKDIFFYSFLIPLFWVILMLRMYKTQVINENKLILYNVITREWINHKGYVQ
jgi:hypothetical protein